MAETQAVQEVVEIAQHSGALAKVGLLAGGLIVGASSGYYMAKRRLEKKYAEFADAEIESMEALYKSKLRQDAATRPAEEIADAIIESEGYTPPPIPASELKEAFQDQHNDHQEDSWRHLGTQPEDPDEEITANVFGDYQDTWDWDYENSAREAGADPYIMHKDEWLSETGGYVRESYTYFEGDDVLADSHDTPVDDMELMVGLHCLTRFGHGSGDPNIVYVRNSELQMEFEVVKSEGKFSEQRRGIIQPPSAPGDPRKRRHRGPH